MLRSPAITLGLLIGIAAAMVWCFSVVISRRFAGGEMYPPGSVQRTDPMGAKVLYEAVDRLASTSCDRNYRPLGKLQGSKGETLVMLYVHPLSFYSSHDIQVSNVEVAKGIDGDAIVKFAAGGGRAVITLQPERDITSTIWKGMRDRQRELDEERLKEKKDKSDKDDAKKSDKDDSKSDPKGKSKDSKSPDDEMRRHEHGPDDRNKEDDFPFKPAKSLRKALQVGIEPTALPPMPENGHVVQTPTGISVLDGKLPRWLSQAVVDLDPKPEKDDEDEDKEGKDAKDAKDAKQDIKSPGAVKDPWRVLATVSGKPVLVERQFGLGSIVIATDSYFATNQALMMHRVPEFLAWLIGDARHVIFDETHLGTQEDPGIMAMARRYHLQGFFLGGVLLFALFVWQSSSSLVPARDGDESGPRIVAGQGAVAALVSLLRRGVPRARLMQTCFDQWVRNYPHPGAAQRTRIEKARAMLPAEVRRPARGALVGLYQRLCETLHPSRN